MSTEAQTRELTAEDRFARDIAAHAVTIMQDDGLRRHLRCAVPGTYCQSFDIITWPGSLCFTGDMGTYVFARIPDMFAFFRHDRPNPDYWAEKVEAQDRHGAIREFDEPAWRRAVEEDVRAFARRARLTSSERRRLVQEVRDEVLSTDTPAADGVRLAMEFTFGDDGGRRYGDVFPDFWEHSTERFTGRFLWCCCALVWAIARYDEMREAARG